MTPLVDSFGRLITYVRLSVTDRCDLRCRYCMSEHMQFVPKEQLLSFEEIETLVDLLVERGVRRIRLTGGEPLVRRSILDLVSAIAARIGRGLEELTLTTNGTQLASAAERLFESGVRRINVSLDSLRSDRFAHITRRGELGRVLDGLAAARAAGLKVKINMVALKGLNEDEIEPMMRWCALKGHDLTLIETMPLGQIEGERSQSYLPLDRVRSELERRFTLTPSTARTGGPARYYDIAELGLRLGFITPISDNFCARCNRIRITATGTLYGCLGNDQKVELGELLRSGGGDAVHLALDRLIEGKPRCHDFKIASPSPAVTRHMSVTGG